MKTKLCVILFVLTLIPMTAFARIGTGIGISIPFPTGSSSSSSSEKSSYASFSDGILLEELIVEEKNGKYVVSFEITNLIDTPYTISHKTGQNYDVALLNEKGEKIAKWSDNIAFTQAFHDEVYKPKETVTYRASFDVKKTKTLRGTPTFIAARLIDTPFTVTAKLPAKSNSERSPVTLHGGIIISNGSAQDWWD
ncbi:MAG: hypothetical protein IKN43_05070 [Selenomonadaceae bacterium]|nr:hypothetical protein [Selenomonadaceae bacterium]